MSSRWNPSAAHLGGGGGRVAGAPRVRDEQLDVEKATRRGAQIDAQAQSARPPVQVERVPIGAAHQVVHKCAVVARVRIVSLVMSEECARPLTQTTAPRSAFALVVNGCVLVFDDTTSTFDAKTLQNSEGEHERHKRQLTRMYATRSLYEAEAGTPRMSGDDGNTGAWSFSSPTVTVTAATFPTPAVQGQVTS